jgi:cytochrome P450
MLRHAFRDVFAHVSSRLSSMQLMPNWIPTRTRRQFGRGKKILDQAVGDLIAHRRQDPNPPQDLLTMLIRGHEERTGKEKSHRLLMDEVLTLLTAGHENMGASLAWTWYLLALNPDVQEKVYDEVRGRLGGRNPTADDLPHLPLSRAIFEESMRMYPPGWAELRETIDADVVQGYPIPPKSIVILCQWVTHRHPDFWPEPEKFMPERFLPAAVASRHRFAYFPFGGGQRICIGLQMALIEGATILATVLQRFRVELVPNQKVELDASFTLRPRDGLKMILRPR